MGLHISSCVRFVSMLRCRLVRITTELMVFCPTSQRIGKSDEYVYVPTPIWFTCVNVTRKGQTDEPTYKYARLMPNSRDTSEPLLHEKWLTAHWNKQPAFVSFVLLGYLFSQITRSREWRKGAKLTHRRPLWSHLAPLCIVFGGVTDIIVHHASI